jgi:hypothetical protein
LAKELFGYEASFEEVKRKQTELIKNATSPEQLDFLTITPAVERLLEEKVNELLKEEYPAEMAEDELDLRSKFKKLARD